MGIVRTKDLVYEYIKRDEDGNVEAVNKAVDNVNIDIEPGQFIAILGHNGSGKSTLAKHINALLLPTEGAVYVEDMSTQDEDKLWDIRQNAGMIFQNPDNQIIGTVVQEDVGFGPENLGVPTDEIWQRVGDALEAVGMTAYREYSPNKLSGGQKQRIAIARALLKDARLILFDEPTASVDIENEEKIKQAIEEIKENHTIITIAHRLNTIENADCIYVVDNGVIAESGTHDELVAGNGIYKRLYDTKDEVSYE
mgnify:CR=1 FL=1